MAFANMYESDFYISDSGDELGFDECAPCTPLLTQRLDSTMLPTLPLSTDINNHHNNNRKSNNNFHFYSTGYLYPSEKSKKKQNVEDGPSSRSPFNNGRKLRNNNNPFITYFYGVDDLALSQIVIPEPPDSRNFTAKLEYPCTTDQRITNRAKPMPIKISKETTQNNQISTMTWR